MLKRIFGFTKVRYRGLHKNANRLFVACGLVNLFMADVVPVFDVSLELD